VCPTKFTVVKTKSGYNFGEFPRFFPQGLNPFNILRRFKFESVRKFIPWILLGICSRPYWESCLKFSNIASYKVWVFLEHSKVLVLNFKIWKEFIYWKKIQTRPSLPVSARALLDHAPVPLRPWSLPFCWHPQVTAVHGCCRGVLAFRFLLTLAHHSLLCSRLPSTRFPVVRHLHSPSLRSKLGQRFAIFPSMCSIRLELEPTITVARRASSPATASSPRNSPTTATLHHSLAELLLPKAPTPHWWASLPPKPKLGPSHPGLHPWRLPHRPSAANRPKSTGEPPVDKGESPPLFWLSWAERPDGPSPCNRAGLAATVGLAHCNSGVYYFLFDLVQIQFK
jgi:hypothetical protein